MAPKTEGEFPGTSPSLGGAEIHGDINGDVS